MVQISTGIKLVNHSGCVCTGCGVESPGYSQGFGGCSGQNAQYVEIKNDVEKYRYRQQTYGDDGKQVQLVAHPFQVLQQLLLFQGIAIGGFADHLKLIFDALERGVLLDNLVAQLAVLDFQIGQAVFEGR